MITKKQKLELTWIGKDVRSKLEPRILLEDPAKSYHAKFRHPPRPLDSFKRCLHSVQKFASEAERVLAVILERDAEKWFKPATGQFLIFYKQEPIILSISRIL